ncbi:hypothetical protein VTK73DRAFT_4001 [Phialemonium thermophilum]|uniref:Peptidase M20 dimerisation domain-containing protein n=1 Tax=Phialemonium thermophilum TaxID=223376 RepID=A0ABR3VD59_9PEZI
MARWREPNLTIHRYRVSGPDGSLVSSHASANISLRLVPGQEVDEVVRALVGFLREQFEQSESGNRLTIRVDNQAEPWLGVPGSYIFRTLEEAVVRAWGLGGDGEDEEDEGEGEGGGEGDGSNGAAVESGSEAAAAPPGPAAPAAPAARPSRAKVRKPLYIREGGSIPAIRFLEKEFDAPAAHLPCGQASDAAHLDNERLRVKNLLKSREIFAHVFRNL